MGRIKGEGLKAREGRKGKGDGKGYFVYTVLTNSQRFKEPMYACICDLIEDKTRRS